MAERLVVAGDPPIEAWLRRSARTRRLCLRVSHLDGRVTLSLPQGVPLCDAEAFLQERSGWLRAALATRPAPVPVVDGSLLPVGGRQVRVCAAGTTPARLALDEGRVFVRPGRPSGPQVARLLRARARSLLEPACAAHAARIGRAPKEIALRDTRSRWGSCTGAGRLMFSWRLAMAPEEVLDYVAAHEVAHLREMNHSPRFWALVAMLCPDHLRHRRWLRDEGASLHRLRFEPGGP